MCLEGQKTKGYGVLRVYGSNLLSASNRIYVYMSDFRLRGWEMVPLDKLYLRVFLIYHTS